MRLRRRRQPEPVAVHVDDVLPVADVVEVPKRKRRTAAEVENNRVEAEQLAQQEREKLLVEARQALAVEWARGSPRPREPQGVAYGTRFIL